MTRQVTITTAEALMLNHELSGFQNEQMKITGLLNHKLPFTIKLQLHKLSSQVKLIQGAYDTEIKPTFERLGNYENDTYIIPADSPNMAEYQKINFELLNSEVSIDVPQIDLDSLSSIEDEYYYSIFAKIYDTQDKA
jgi:hypothetical protein